jgi:hypothetical protein
VPVCMGGRGGEEWGGGVRVSARCAVLAVDWAGIGLGACARGGQKCINCGEGGVGESECVFAGESWEKT